MFGLRAPVVRGTDYTMLDEALAARTVEIGEVSEGGSVPQLKVTNRGARAVLLVASSSPASRCASSELNACYSPSALDFRV